MCTPRVGSPTFGLPDPAPRRGLPEHAPSRAEEAGELVQRAAERPAVRGAVGPRGGGAGAGPPVLGPGCAPRGVGGLAEGAARAPRGRRAGRLGRFGHVGAGRRRSARVPRGLRGEGEVCGRPGRRRREGGPARGGRAGGRGPVRVAFLVLGVLWRQGARAFGLQRVLEVGLQHGQLLHLQRRQGRLVGRRGAGDRGRGEHQERGTVREQVGERGRDVARVFAGPSGLAAPVAVLPGDGVPTVAQQRGRRGRLGGHEVLHLLVHGLGLLGAAGAARHLDVDGLGLGLGRGARGGRGGRGDPGSALRAASAPRARHVLRRAAEPGVGAALGLARGNLLHGAVVVAVRSGPGEHCRGQRRDGRC